MERGAWALPNRTEGVCFSLKPLGGGEPLWRRCLDPLHVEADRTEQSALVDIPAGTNEVSLETSCRASCDWGWSYIKDAKPLN